MAIPSFIKVTPVFLDGAIYVGLALFTFLQTQFGGDEAAQHISAQVLFWLKLNIGSLSACALALKMYRSTAYADSKNGSAKNSNGLPPSVPPAVSALKAVDAPTSTATK